MSRKLKLLALVAVLGLTAMACGGGEEEPPGGETGAATGPTAPEEQIPVGGTLQAAIVSDVSAGFDPQKEYYQLSWEFYRCCLTRTLMNYNGMPVDQGGTEAQPDLAAGMPEQSADGLTWTFNLQTGIMYAPPFQDTEVHVQDIIRAVERTADPDASLGGYGFYYSVIEGFDDFGDEKADSISGLEALDDYTLTVTTTRPAGDVPNLFAMPATAPIPANPDSPDATLGVAEGHTEDYGRYLVSTGPYMFEGSENLDFSLPPKDQPTLSGVEVGKFYTIVRNPSYDPSTDTLRGAYIDRYEVAVGGDPVDLLNKVEAGDIDLCIDCGTPPDFLRRYQTNPDLQPFLHINPSGGNRYISFNLAIPPMDDIHVRKALNLATDKDGSRKFRGGPPAGDVATHIVPDALLNDLLVDYNPYPSPNDQGDIEAAKAEMAQSKYDTDGDGVCDAPECKDILMVVSEASPPYPEQTALLQDNWGELGLTFNVKQFEHTTMYSKCSDPATKAAVCPSVGWLPDYFDAATVIPPLFGTEGLYPAYGNLSLLGADAAYLEEYGYDPIEIPSVDDKIEECAVIPAGDARFECWANLDRYIMEEVVNWVPLLFDTSRTITGERIVNFVHSASAGMEALDRLALAEGSA